MKIFNYKKGETDEIGGWLGCMVLIVIIGVVALFGLASNSNEENHTIKVTDKNITHTSDSSHYLVFTDDQVYKIDDAVLRGRFNSSDLYSRIKINTCYEIKTVGFRIPVFSEYKNIISAEKIDCN